MASINGITVKGLKQFVGHEGEPLFQGNLYLNGKKIGFWSQGDWGGPDRFQLDGGWQQEKTLDEAVKAMYPERAHHGVSHGGEPYVVEYGLEFLMTDILDLIQDEKKFKGAVKNGYAGILVATDGFHETVWSLPAAYTALSNEALLAKMDGVLKKTMESFFPEDEYRRHQVKVYRNLKDFDVGEPLLLVEKSLDTVVRDAAKRSEKGSRDQVPETKEDIDK